VAETLALQQWQLAPYATPTPDPSLSLHLQLGGRVTILTKLLEERKSQHHEGKRSKPRALLHVQVMDSDT